METLDAIFTRKSVREFTEQKVSEDIVHTILRAGMSGPSCVNARDWEFIVVTDHDKLMQMADANGRPAEPLRKAAFGVLLCGNTDRAFAHAKDYWVIDAAIAGQNMTLAAHDLGIGSVWLGTWPQMDRVEKQAKLFNLPKNIVPHSVFAFGYPQNNNEEVRDQYDAERVHIEKW